MKLNVKNTLFVTILYLSMTNLGHALDLDVSVDDEIRKNYNHCHGKYGTCGMKQ